MFPAKKLLGNVKSFFDFFTVDKSYYFHERGLLGKRSYGAASNPILQ